VAATCFFLGLIFSLFPYDYPLLWSATPTPLEYYDYVEAHMRFLHNSPPLIPRILHIVMFLGIGALLAKLYKPSESNMLFDGASLVLYMCGVVVYFANIIKGLRIVSAGDYGKSVAPGIDEAPDGILGREESLKVLAASNTILALVLVGVLVLQAGQWYAERSQQAEAEKLNKLDQEKKEKEKKEKETSGTTTSAPARVTRQSSATSKKKQ
jgi:hypothetical protein